MQTKAIKFNGGSFNGRRELAVYGGLLVMTGLWCLAIVAAPWLAARGQITASLLIYRAFSAICHQIPERSFHFHNLPFGVCARCTGIYAGFAVGLLLYPWLRDLREDRFPARWILLGAALPMVIDFAVGWLGIFANTFLSRSVTGALFGAVAAFYILPGLVGTFTRAEEQCAVRPTSQESLV